MLILDATTKKLEVLLGGAVTTNELPIVAAYVDHNPSAETLTPGSSDTITTGATPVTAVAAPGSGVQRQVKYLSIFNDDTENATVTVQLDNNGTDRELVEVTLAPGSSLVYRDREGWMTLDNGGNILSGAGSLTTDPTPLTLTPGGAVLPASGGAVLTQDDDTNESRQELDFEDSGVDEAFWVVPNQSIDDLDIWWRCTPTTNNAKWQVELREYGDDDSLDKGAADASGTVTDAANGGAGDLSKASITGLGHTKTAGKGVLNIRIFRDPGDAADTLGATATFVMAQKAG